MAKRCHEFWTGVEGDETFAAGLNYRSSSALAMFGLRAIRKYRACADGPGRNFRSLASSSACNELSSAVLPSRQAIGACWSDANIKRAHHTAPIWGFFNQCIWYGDLQVPTFTQYNPLTGVLNQGLCPGGGFTSAKQVRRVPQRQCNSLNYCIVAVVLLWCGLY